MFTYLRKAAPLLPFVLAVGLLTACGKNAHEHAHHHGAEEQEDHGPHGGQLLRQGDVDLELGIHEAGGPPHFRAYLRNDGKPVAPQSFSVEVSLTRLGGARALVRVMNCVVRFVRGAGGADLLALAGDLVGSTPVHVLALSRDEPVMPLVERLL